MHLINKDDSSTYENNCSTYDNNDTMPIVELEYRQTSGDVKSLEVGSGFQPKSSCLKYNIRLNNEHSGNVTDNIYAVTSIPSGDREMSSRQEKQTKCQSLSLGTNEYYRGVCSHGNKILIHHQRHSLKNRFHLIRTLGEGTYGKVKLAADKGTGEHVAIKYIRKTKILDENDQARIRREIQILSSLKHKHVVNIREVFEKKDKIVLVMDYAPGGELYDYLDKMGTLPEREARRIFRQIVSAIHHCHENSIVHRDLKLENIILDEHGNVKMADFGLSNFFSSNFKLTTFCGSPLYASPEIVNGQPYQGPEVDVWSLGVILYTLVYGAMPFESTNLALLKRHISTGNYIQPSPPSDAAGLIRHMLAVKPSRRASLEDVLRHWWVNLGYSHMPNDMPYNPDQELSHETPILATGRKDSSDSSCTDHHSYNNSISSDSDVELDFKPNSKRCVSNNEKCNSGSSSMTSGSSPSYNRHRHCTDDSADSAIPPALLTLPSDVLEILKECSRKTLAALISSDKISSAFHVDINDEKVVCQKNEEFGLTDNLDSVQTSISVSVSEKKPTKGILKRKGKFSGGDSGCVMPEDMSTKIDDITSQELGDLSHELHSLVVDTNDVFEKEHDCCFPVDNNSHCIQSHANSSSFVSKFSWCTNFPQTLTMPQENHQQFLHMPATNKNVKDSQSLQDCRHKTIPGFVTKIKFSHSDRK